MIKNSSLALLIVLISTSAFSQRNLVKNPGFEVTKGKVKDSGQIEVATDWTCPLEIQSDLYSEFAKNELLMVPENAMGSQPAKGSNYAGFIGYSYKEAQSRTYVQGQLREPLVQGETYCVKFHLSLSDVSKYAVNELGAYMSAAGATQQNILNFEIQPQVKHPQNLIQDEMYGFIPICGHYTATGGEQYITIGNFTPQDEVKSSTMKRPKGFTKPQQAMAYYYLDKISVIHQDSLKNEFECSCDGKISSSNETTRIVKRTYGSVDINDFPKIEFDAESAELTESSTQTLDEVYQLLKHEDYATTRFKVVGYVTAEEKSGGKGGLATSRAMAVRNYLLKKGIQSNRLSLEDKPAPSGNSPTVVFKVAN